MSKQPTVNTAEISFKNLDSGILATITDPRTGLRYAAAPSVTEIIPTEQKDGSDDFTRYGYDVILNGKRETVTLECLDYDQAQDDLRNFLALQEPPIDITDPINWRNFVDECGVVWYRHSSGSRLGFPVRVPANDEGCGWWQPEGAQEAVHFKVDDYHVRMSLCGKTTIIFRPDL